MQRIHSFLSDSFDDKLFWAAASTGWFGFLRCGEFTSRPGYSPETVLLRKHCALLPDSLRLCLPASKTDPFRLGVTIAIGKSCDDLCASKAMSRYLAVHPTGNPEHPLFMRNGQPMSRSWFLSRLRHFLALAGLNPDHYSGHSLRMGAATQAALAGVPDHLIQLMGRWKSEAYKLYITTPLSAILACAPLMTSARA
jgi:hypothetical protein